MDTSFSACRARQASDRCLKSIFDICTVVCVLLFSSVCVYDARSEKVTTISSVDKQTSVGRQICQLLYVCGVYIRTTGRAK